MKKTNKLFLYSFITIFIISIFFNILVIEKYDLISKFYYKILYHFNPPSNISSKPPYSMKDNKPIVFYLNNNNVKKVNKSLTERKKIIPDNLFIKPGNYTFLGDNYSLEKEGLYRFLMPGKVNAQRIVFKNNIDALLSALAWIATHGNADDKITNQELSEKALVNKLYITCGKLSIWVDKILKNKNIKSRIVLGMTIDDWNNYDNGHTLIEIYRKEWNKWVLYDIDNNSYFVNPKNNIPLNLIEFSKAISKDTYKIIHLSNDTRLDISNFISSNGYNYGFFSEEVIVNIRDWYRRVMQVPLIFDASENKYIFTDKDNKNKILSYSPKYKYMNQIDFLNKFYNK